MRTSAARQEMWTSVRSDLSAAATKGAKAAYFLQRTVNADEEFHAARYVMEARWHAKRAAHHANRALDLLDQLGSDK